MASQSKITITHDKESTADLVMKNITQAKDPRSLVIGLSAWLDRIVGGLANGKVDLTIDDGNGVAASGTITLTGVGQANDTILINGVTFTAKASGATGNEWNVGGSATLSAAAIAAAINASASALVSGHVTATSALGVVTITSKVANVYGNAVTIAEGVDGLSHMAVSGARLTGGTAPTNASSSSSVSVGV
jgi:phage tail sheath gpL-like